MKDPDLAISWLLRIGVLLSAGLIMVGMIIHLTGRNGRLIIIAGLLVLIATPVARVVFSIFIFLREGDRLYVAITSAVLLILLFGFAVGATGADLPPIPPLPATSWPAAEVAEPFARDLLMQEPAAELAQALAAQPELMPSVLRNLGTAMMSSDAALVDNLHRYLADVTRAAKTNIASIVILDPLRYLEDTAFRKRMTEFLPETMAGLTRDTARSVLDQLDASASLDFDTFEKIAAAHGVVRRASSVRQSAFTDKLRMPDDVSGPIETSFYSLSSAFFKPDEVKRFLDAVHAASPKRHIVVLGDAAIRRSLPAGVTFVDDHARAFTPWPRDPFILARHGKSVVFVNRPNAQPNREEDRNMARMLVDQWDDVSWTVAPIPFHNGHILLTPAAVWISIHTVEFRALSLLGLDHVPTESFGPYLDAVRQAAGELQAFYRRPVRFVHPLSDMALLGGGAGFDLDSIVTILPPSNALVGDIELGMQYGGQRTS
ncbi:MAG TPA: DUF1634 domain-containing protein, partial [Thermoanaerobaculia bacterium]